MQTSQLICDAIKRKIYYDLLQDQSPDSKTEFLCALDAIEGGLGCVPSGLPGCTEQARAIDGLLQAITRDYANGSLISITGESVTDPDEREHGRTPTAVFRVVLDFAVQRTVVAPVCFPETIDAMARVVAIPGTAQATASAEGCRLTAGEITACLNEGLSVTP